ncbi:MAG: F0F1 ATP synthase subunit alpha, partial [Xanthomonadales bacterium]|nr:F0F1 ATP synthase subunit alpha [Xanthomonadales bacterium]
AQYRELAAFAQFASDLDAATRAQLERGQRVTELMKQAQYAPMNIAYMALSLYAAEKGYLDDIPVSGILAFEKGLHSYFDQNQAALLARIVETGDWDGDIEATFKAGIEDFKKTGSW